MYPWKTTDLAFVVHKQSYKVTTDSKLTAQVDATLNYQCKQSRQQGVSVPMEM